MVKWFPLGLAIASRVVAARFDSPRVRCFVGHGRILHVSPEATTDDGAKIVILSAYFYRVDGRETNMGDEIMEAAAPTPLFDGQRNFRIIAIINSSDTLDSYNHNHNAQTIQMNIATDAALTSILKNGELAA